MYILFWISSNKVSNLSSNLASSTTSFSPLSLLDNGEKETVELSKLNERLGELLEEIQESMFKACEKRREEKTTVAYSLEEIIKNLEENQGYVKTMWCGDVDCENKIKEETGAHSRCIPFAQEHLADTCPVCGKKADKMVVWGRQY